MRIDAHIHLYDPGRPQGVPWPPKHVQALYRPHLVEDFAHVSSDTGITHAIVVEASPWVDDNRWLLDITRECPEILGIVGNLDPRSDDFRRHLTELAADGRFLGIRPRLQPVPDLGDTAVVANLACLADHGLTLEFNVPPYDIGLVAAFAQAHPRVRVVITHLAGARLVDGQVDSSWRASLDVFRTLPNSFCKLSAFYASSGERPAPVEPEHYADVVAAVVDVFGMDRVFFGSNWPVSKLGGEYAPLPRIAEACVRGHGDAAAAAVFRDNTLRAYGLTDGVPIGWSGLWLRERVWERMCARSVLSRGNPSRLAGVMRKAARGEAVTVGVIGGSITGGAKASTVQRRYGNRLVSWMRGRFPQAQVKLVNAGVGGTGSNYGCLRAEGDLLRHNPDLVIVEFGVNDSSARAASQATLEGLLRQILGHAGEPAVVLLFMMTSKPPDFPELERLAMDGRPVVDGGRVKGLNVQHWHAPIGEHYGVPMVSFRDAVWPEMVQGWLRWEDVIADAVHPNDVGHAWTAVLLARLLEAAVGERPADDGPAVTDMPSALVSDRFEHVEYRRAEALAPVSNDGWRLEKGDWHGQWWRADAAGSEVVFEVNGTGAVVVLSVGRERTGRARISVDDGPARTERGWHGGPWGNLVRPVDLGDGLAPGPHRVRIRALPAEDGGADTCDVRIHGIAGTGTR